MSRVHNLLHSVYIYNMARKLRNLIGIVKDKASLIKATLSVTNRSASSRRVAVLLATTHDPSSPPSEHRLSAVLGCQGARHTSSACVEVLMDRLNDTGSAVVALKCLVVAHTIVSRGTFILRDQISIYPSSGGHNFLNLSTFRDKSDTSEWQLSAWVRWYAAMVEQNLMVSRALGYYFCSKITTLDNYEVKRYREEKARAGLSAELLSETDSLVAFVERTRDAPDSWHDLQKNDLVYKVVRLVGEDYKFVQDELSLRIKELGDRMKGVSYDELTRFLNALKRLEDCKERLLSMFLIRKRDGDFWDLIGGVKLKVVEIMMEKRENNMRLVRVGERQYNEQSESRMFWRNNPFVEPEQLLRLPSGDGGWSSLGVIMLGSV